MATVIGVDLGSHTVKLAVMEQRLGKVQVQEYRVRRVVGAEATPTLSERLAALGELVSELGPEENTTWAVGMPGNRVSTRLIKLPFSDRERIEQTLPFELERFVPFDPEDFILDWRMVPSDGEGARVLCALAHHDEVKATLEGLQAVGVDPKHLVLDADALGVFSDTADHVQAIVDIGHDRTLVCLSRGDEVLAVRAISRGGGDLTHALVHAMNVDVGGAEGQKHVASLRAAAVVAEWDAEDPTDAHLTDPKLGSARPGTQNTTAVLSKAIQPWLASLRVTLIALEDDLGVDVDEVLLSGGGSSLDGMTQLLAQDLGVPVRAIQLGDAAEAEGDPGRFALAHALAQRAAGLTTGRELHFRKDEFAFKGDLATLRSVFGLAAVALVVFCIAGTGLYAWKMVQYNSEIAKVEADIAQTVKDAFPETSDTQLQTPSLAKAIMLEKTTATLERVDALGSTVSGEPPILTALLQVSESVPPHDKAVLDINDLTINETGINIRAETSGYEAAATIESALQSNERFATAKKGEETKKGDKLKFAISIPFEDETEEEG